MIPPGILSASLASDSPTRRLRSSLSRTQGPAMRNSLSAGKNSATLFRRFYGRALAATSRRRLCLHRGGDEAREKRMGTGRARLQLGMELTADVPWVGLELDDLHQRSIGRE